MLQSTTVFKLGDSVIIIPMSQSKRTNRLVVANDIDNTATIEHTLRFQYESLINAWITISLSLIVAAVLIHINLNLVIGSCIIFTGLILVMLTVVEAALLYYYAEQNIRLFVKIRHGIIITKYILLIVTMAFFVWAAVVMIIRTTPTPVS